MKLLSAGLGSPHCKLETFRSVGLNVQIVPNSPTTRSPHPLRCPLTEMNGRRGGVNRLTQSGGRLLLRSLFISVNGHLVGH